MSGETDLKTLLKTLRPELLEQEFVFCSVQGELMDYSHLNPVASFMETEGLSLIVPLALAEQHAITYTGIFKQISLSVHSSLEAVGLTAAIASALAAQGISANVVAAYYHDHIFVPRDKAEASMKALSELCHD
jgi:hypothetical protein